MIIQNIVAPLVRVSRLAPPRGGFVLHAEAEHPLEVLLKRKRSLVSGSRCDFLLNTN
jgi:hypothetical protein